MSNKFTCPSGHTHNLADFGSYVELDVEELTDAVILTCPGGKREHQFSLRKAIGAGMFTVDEAKALTAGAEALKKKEATLK